MGRTLSPLILEICIDSLESARAAEAGGADRVELCSALHIGGLTPSDALLRSVRTALKIDIFAMVRPRGGTFVYSQAELREMLAAIRHVRDLGADGVVLGALTPANTVDGEMLTELVAAARPMKVTFHRAFDVCVELHEALEQVIAAGADRVLTAGGSGTASQALPQLQKLVQSAGDRIAILAGGGVRESNVRELVLATGVHEVHSSMGFSEADARRTQSSLARPRNGSESGSSFVVSEKDVRAMRNVLTDLRTESGVPAADR